MNWIVKSIITTVKYCSKKLWLQNRNSFPYEYCAFRMLFLKKSQKHNTKLNVQLCAAPSNHSREPTKCRIEWIGVSPFLIVFFLRLLKTVSQKVGLVSFICSEFNTSNLECRLRLNFGRYKASSNISNFQPVGFNFGFYSLEASKN